MQDKNFRIALVIIGVLLALVFSLGYYLFFGDNLDLPPSPPGSGIPEIPRNLFNK